MKDRLIGWIGAGILLVGFVAIMLPNRIGSSREESIRAVITADLRWHRDNVVKYLASGQIIVSGLLGRGLGVISTLSPEVMPESLWGASAVARKFRPVYMSYGAVYSQRECQEILARAGESGRVPESFSIGYVLSMPHPNARTFTIRSRPVLGQVAVISESGGASWEATMQER